jgi:hypothetical protein
MVSKVVSKAAVVFHSRFVVGMNGDYCVETNT